MIMAAGLLCGAILNFDMVTSDRAKLVLIAAYTIAFALCVGLLTNARRSEIFAACAAYVAVIVVIVSSGLGTSSGSSSASGTPHR
jgi:FtsH-binding integral membrane protein